MLQIREERLSERRETEELVREAFWNVYAPGCVEHYLLHRMRTCGVYRPELSLVAEEGGHLLGQVICLPGVIHGDGGQRHEVLTLGPIAVLPTAQGRGIGGALLERMAETAAALGHRAILLCGDPAYYSRHGFVSAEAQGIRNGEDLFLDALQVRGLCPGALEGLAGRYAEDPVYNVDLQAAEDFDRGFPPKARLSDTPSQQRFLELASRARPYRG